MVKPFLKWVGSKRKLAATIIDLLPKEFNVYHEIFLGSGAVFFALQPNKAYLCDTNWELINCFKQVRDNSDRVISILEEMELGYISNEAEGTGKDYYVSIRNLDRDRQRYKLLSTEYKAARFIFINRKGFNGLWRVNKSGYCNVPQGDNSNKICDRDTILRCAQVLQSAKLFHQDMVRGLLATRDGDVIYLDPPYVPTSITSSFCNYTKNGFGKYQQETLAQATEQLSHVGRFWILSNSDTQWVRDRYKNNKMIEVSRSGAINCKGDKRSQVAELLITNKRKPNLCCPS